jgi:hypothetical protein
MASAAAAQNPLVLNKLKELDAKAPQPAVSELRSAVATTAKAYAEKKGTCAPSEVTLSEVSPITGARGILQGVMSGQLRNAWTLYVQYVGCSGADPHRFMVVQKGDGSLIALQVNEGRTYANPSIMRDTSAMAAMTALQKGRSLDPTCKGESMKMGPTRVTGQSKDLGPDIYGARYVGSWTEVWQFETCGKKFDVPIEFTPDADGGAYTNIKGDAVVVVP